jgi:Spy/CpxP family protein refolding chaperone
MHYKTTLIVFILSAFLALPLLVFAQAKKDVKIIMKKGAPTERIEFDDEEDSPDFPIFHKLNLTEDQEKDFMKLRFEMQKKQTDASAKVQTAQIELKELFSADIPDRAAIEKQIKEIADLKTRLHLNRLDHWFAVNKILTPEQQKIWKKQFGKHRGIGIKDGGMRFGPKMEMRIQKEFKRDNSDDPKMDSDNN